LSLTGRAGYHGSFPLNRDGQNFVALSPDGQLLALLTDTAIELWNLPTRTRTTSLPPHRSGSGLLPPSDRIVTGALDATPHWLAIAWDNGTVNLYDLTAPHAAAVTVNHTGNVRTSSLAFSPDGRTLALGSNNYDYYDELTISLWTIATHQRSQRSIGRPT